MARRKKKFGKSDMNRPGAFLAAAMALYRSIDARTPARQPLVPVTSYDYLDHVCRVISYRGNRVSLFLQVCGKVGLKSQSSVKKILEILDCFTADYKKIIRTIQSDEAKKKKFKLHAPPICPACNKTLYVHDLSYLAQKKNRKSFKSHWFCITCFYELYSHVAVDQFGFPESAVDL